MKKQFLTLTLLAAAWLAGGSAQAWDQPAQDANGVYQIGTASELEWFSEFVAGNSNGVTAAVLTADLDFTGVTHTPIGPNKDAKFNGTFDGQYHHIKNLVINTTNNYQGIFGWVRGGSTIKNFTIDATCSFTGGDRTAAVVATLNTSAGTDSPMQILNIVNHANVNSASGAVSAFIGASDNAVFFKIHNCVNTGNITTTGSEKYAVVANGWSNGNPGANSQVWNVVNTGTISPIDGTNTFFRGNYRSVKNSYDVINYGMQATYISPSAIHSGELCYKLNQGETIGQAYTQDLSDPNSIPMPIPDGPTVYQNTDYYCGDTPTAKGSYTYSNTELTASNVPASHSFSNETGLCTFCSYPKEEWKSASNDGYYHLSNATDVEWFSHMVRDAGHGAMNAKLDADIDFGGVPNAHLPIGSSGKKYFGHFDGQNHRIIGMVLNTASKLNNRGYDGNGFFGSVRGGGTDSNGTYTNEVIIENLIIDASCSIEHDNNFAAGVVAHINSRYDENSNIIIRNCGNEANVTTSGKNAAGILGCVEGTNVGLKLYNLWNKGNIVGRSGESAAICAWTGQRNVDGEVDVEGCWNIGEVTGIDGNHYNMIRRNTNIVPRNIVDLCIANKEKGGEQGVVSVWNTANPISSGELCYLLNGDQSTIVYTQTIGTDEMPVYGTSSLQVYEIAVSSAGWASFVPAVNIATLPTGVTAYVGQIQNNGATLHLEAVTALPADNAFVVNAAEGNYYYNNTSETITLSETNDLQVATSAFDPTTENTIYCLAKKNGNVGFYPVATTVTIPARKVYLEITSGEAPVKGFYGFDDDDATGIEGVKEVQEVQGAIYNLSGQRISKMQKGINIVNGKKVLK